ncbi:hypothetical protein KCP77_13840 [Salmonella enterica subsp. enterica]|nr:hypothetical protein KCP77_13840 [Salmonella enterica subsp. enterica]
MSDIEAQRIAALIPCWISLVASDYHSAINNLEMCRRTELLDQVKDGISPSRAPGGRHREIGSVICQDGR